jgi:aspartyl-tRNA(Asn)/glutamyl-tRNA(Gln) amidotransferase subunit A
MENQTIPKLREKLIRGDISPREMLSYYLGRIERTSELNAMITVNQSEAETRAKKLEALTLDERKKLPLYGLPIAIKDNIVTKGIRTTAGSKMLESFIPPYQATVTQKLIDAGAIIVGKTNLDEFAMGASTETSYFGPAKNPWDSKRVPGGSSGGSAIAASCGLAVGALASDTGGSIRQPASFCNVTGMKPTYGRVSRYGLIAYASSLDQIGPMAKSVIDVEILTRIICGHDPRDSTSSPNPVFPQLDERGTDLRGVRIGIPDEFFIEELAPDIKALILTAADVLQGLGATLTNVSLPHTKLAIPTYYIIAPAEASSNLSRYDGIRYGHRSVSFADLEDLYAKSRSEGFGEETQRRIIIGSYVLSSGYYDAFYRKAQKVRALIKSDYDRVLGQECDLILAPVTPTPAFKLGEKTSDPITMYMCDIFTAPINLAGLPALSLPCGFTATENLPVGMQLIGPNWSEANLFKAGYAYQNATSWHSMEPTYASV